MHAKIRPNTVFSRLNGLKNIASLLLFITLKNKCIVEASAYFLLRPIKGLSIRAGIHLFKSSPIRNSLGVELPIVAGKDVRAVLFSCPREEDEVPVAEAIGLERELLRNWKYYWSKAEMVEPSNLGMHRFGDLARANTTAT